MDSATTTRDEDDFELDILGQQSRINRIYTQITLCFPLPVEPAADLEPHIVRVLSAGFHRLTASFPWIGGTVVNNQGRFKVKQVEDQARIVVKDLKNDVSFPSWSTLKQARFPFMMLDESIVAPRNTLAISDNSGIELPVLLVQASFVRSGLLLTFNGQHGSMDMTGLGQVMYLFAKACRKEAFTPVELSVGNMSRKNIIPLPNDSHMQSTSETNTRSPTRTADTIGQSKTQLSQLASDPWAYFSFPATALAKLKSLAMTSVSFGSFVSTDDVLTAFIWQAISRSRLPRLEIKDYTQNSTLSRNVDVRRFFSVPSTYPGCVSDSTVHTSQISELTREPLGMVATRLRSALAPDMLRDNMRTAAAQISLHGHAARANFAANSNPELDVRLSSWAKETCYELDFGLGYGIGRPEAVRRPRFTGIAREGLVYLLPKSLDGEIVVGACLRNEDLNRLRADGEFAKYSSYIG